MRIEPGKNYLLSFYVFTGVAPSSAAVQPNLVVAQSIDDYDYNELQTIEVTSRDSQWTLFELPVTNADGNFMKFAFRGNMSNVYEHIWLDNISISEQTPDAIEEIKLTPDIVVTESGVTVNGAASQPVAIYGVDGRLIHHFTATSTSTCNLPTGIYIVTVGSKAHKISIK